jgi:hypothetical protein
MQDPATLDLPADGAGWTANPLADLGIGKPLSPKRLYLNAFFPAQMLVLTRTVDTFNSPHADVPFLRFGRCGKGSFWHGVLYSPISDSLIYSLPMRTAIDGNELVENQEINIGIAVALEEGLLVPVVKKVDTMTLSELSDRSKDLARRARERKLEPDELQGGSFTVTNLGMFGISSFTPIINLPQSAILGVNAAEDELYLDNGEVRSKKVMTLSLTIDHRVIDGAQGAVFLNDLAQLIEAPLKILI